MVIAPLTCLCTVSINLDHQAVDLRAKLVVVKPKLGGDQASQKDIRTAEKCNAGTVQGFTVYVLTASGCMVRAGTRGIGK